MQKLIMLLAAILFALPVRSECLQMSDQGLKSIDQDAGGTPITWQATLNNQCDEYIYAKLTIQLLDEQDNELYTLRTTEAFNYREQRTIENQVYIPSDVADRLEGINIRLNELD